MRILGKASACAVALVVLAASEAHAITLGSPAEGAITSSTATFTWGLGTGEEASSIEISPNPALGSGGGFANDEELRYGSLQATQTSYTVGSAEPLFAGTWYWHVSVFDEVPCCDFRWSEIRRLQVRDEPIKVSSFDAEYLSCIKKVQFNFEYEDNSRDQAATWKVLFSRKRQGKSAAKRHGVAGESDFGSVYDSFKRPKQLRFGRKYFVRLEVRDPAGQVTEVAGPRIRIKQC